MNVPSLPSLETGPSQDVVQVGPVPDRRLNAILALRIPEIGCGQDKERKRTQKKQATACGK